METPFFCRECGNDHHEPADARLGFNVICLDCAPDEAPAIAFAAAVTIESLAA